MDRCLKVLDNSDGSCRVNIESQEQPSIKAGEVLVRVHYSSINYKDALAVTGKGKILKSFPLTPGVDMSGTVLDGGDSGLPEGSKVLVNGCGFGEQFDGGFASFAKVSRDILVPLPDELSLKEAMVIGTAGFTAGLCLERFLANEQMPDNGPIVVTGASGGVGQFATLLLSQMGYDVWAVSAKTHMHAHLTSLGAAKVCRLEELELTNVPLGKRLFAGAIDNLGGEALGRLLAHSENWGNVACVGMASGAEVSSTVMPFILRGVSCLGISSTNCPIITRRKIWSRLGSSWKVDGLEKIINKEVGLDDLPEACQLLVNNNHTGRTVVKLYDGE